LKYNNVSFVSVLLAMVPMATDLSRPGKPT